jgi:hypothetical protein
MFENRIHFFESSEMSACQYSENIYTRQYNTALNRFRSTLRAGKFSRLKRKVVHRPQFLYDLSELKHHLSLLGSCYAGIQAVPISSIIGSEGRTADFDADFHPLKESARERWVNMAMAYLARLSLPPIELIQVGNVYFVRDGHHRISVSRAFGQVAMDAEVITWKASPPFPWEAGALQAQPTFLSKALGNRLT